jgi:signal transduction histidine kinase
MRLNYKQKIFIYFLLIFALFSAGIVVFEQLHAKKYKTEALEEKLDTYSGIINEALVRYKTDDYKSTVDSLLQIFPESIRITLINNQGKVVYDNVIDSISGLENHFTRPEVVKARETGSGSNIRRSASNQHEYLYYAKRYNPYFIRIALPYDIRVRTFLQPDNLFLYYIIALFVVALYFINLLSGRFGKSIKQLRDFMPVAGNEEGNIHSLPHFPDDELGEIGNKIVENYKQLADNRKKIIREREKLLQHILNSEEGLCFFTKDKTVEFKNGLFLQYVNTIVDEPTVNPLVIFNDEAFRSIQSFLSNRKADDNYFETKIRKQGKCFAVRVNIFVDGNFEVTINDVTEQEKNQMLKQEMTGNIAHELRTPVTSIRGYLETILEQHLTEEQKNNFITKAYHKVLILSALIQDISLINKIEEAPGLFRVEPVKLHSLIQTLIEDLDRQINAQNITLQINIPENVEVKGNYQLIYSIFRNLTDNVINYAGKNISIIINKYDEDDRFFYFSFADTGAGVDESHLNRLFERFYRVAEGRTRDTGGTGLGLSIVKNAILFHKGTIVAKNKVGGGLEFLFKLPK